MLRYRSRSTEWTCIGYCLAEIGELYRNGVGTAHVFVDTQLVHFLSTDLVLFPVDLFRDLQFRCRLTARELAEYVWDIACWDMPKAT